jgi:protein-L-isoaspartate(D-aspartate) O-methyltransferase
VDALVAAARAMGVRDPRVIDAVGRVRREMFVPPLSAGLADYDEPIPIPHGVTTSQPSLVAAMVEALALQGDENVLEIGTGYGYETALLAHLSRTVWSIEWWDDLAAAAQDNLARAGVTNVTVVTGDGGEGLPDHAPYDAIVVTAAAPTVPPPLVEQLADGGRLVQPVGRGGAELVRLFVKRDGTLTRERDLVPARFVPLVGPYGSGGSGGPGGGTGRIGGSGGTGRSGGSGGSGG